MNYDSVIDRLLEYFTGHEYEEEVAAAKDQFFGELGEGPGETETFEMRMSQFLDWYLFSRNLNIHKTPPILWALQSADYKIDEAERIYYANLAEIRHSLFEFLKVSKTTLVVKDLLTGKKLQLKNAPIIEGFDRAEVFEARVFPHEDTFMFTNGFCFHPADANKFVHKEIKKERKLKDFSHEGLMFRLMKMRYKYDRYRHIPLEMIYSNESKLKF